MTIKLPPLAKTIAQPRVLAASHLIFFAAFMLSAATTSDITHLIYVILGLAGVIAMLWHMIYLALVMGNPSRMRQSLAVVFFIGAPQVWLEGTAFAWSGWVGDILETIGALSLFGLVGLAGFALARVFDPGSKLSVFKYAVLAWLAVIASFFYFKSAHDKAGRPRPTPEEFAPVLSFPPPPQDRTADYLAFWTRFRRTTGQSIEQPRYVDAFGDSPEMHDELLALVLAGTKQATASLARWYTEEELPKVGDLVLITDGRGAPACVIRTTQVDIMPVREVDAEFAFVEGEGDRSYEYWITEHRKFWTREAEREGFDYSDDLDVVCERFEMIWSPRR